MTPTTSVTGPLHLSKHQGAGNDFLVLVDREGATPIDRDLARALCDRRFGIGADGVIRVLADGSGADLTMELRNADGSEAEMSGNGVRCLAQAAVDAGLVAGPRLTVSTSGGVRHVVIDESDGDDQMISVDMGTVGLGSERPPPESARRAIEVDVGNPHLVLLVPDPSGIDVAATGSALQHEFPDGINVEFVATGPQPEALTLRVWERGAGETLACGTGSVAAAAAARSWGEVGDRVEVHNPGGTLLVLLDGERARLSGPVRKVADLLVEPGSLLAGARS